MKTGDWLFLAITGLCTLPLQAAIIYTLWLTFREPGVELALLQPEPAQLQRQADRYSGTEFKAVAGGRGGCIR